MDEKIVFQKYQALSSEEAMRLAIQVAEEGAPFVSPNPLVGCVIVNRQHQFLASGFHARYGEAHAEVNALQKLTAEELVGSTFYVTLEPCAHQGKTPSCAKTLAQLNIKSVVYGLVDPNPLVQGTGALILQQAGIEAIEYQGPLKGDLEDLCEIFLTNFTHKKTFIAAKVAASLDGKIGLKSGDSRWITSEQSRQYVHQIRSWYDAILVGRKTIEVDNPSLNIRHPMIQKTNKIVIVDPSAQIVRKIKKGQKFQFTNCHRPENIFFALSPQVEAETSLMEFLQSENFQSIVFTSTADLKENFWKKNIKSVFIEGGAETYAHFFKNGLVDRLHLFLAPQIIGGLNGLGWSDGFGIQALSDRLVLKKTKICMKGSDYYLTGRFF